MPKFAANLTFLFTERPFPERFSAAADLGFKAVEFISPYDHPPDEIRQHLERHNVELALFNVPMTGPPGCERGMGALPERREEFAAGLDRALVYAKATGCRRIHVLSGTWAEGRDRRDGEACYIDNLKRSSDKAEKLGVTLQVEPLNKQDMPGYFIRTTEQGMDIVRRVDRSNVRLQLDLYHRQMTEGLLSEAVTGLAGWYSHIQIANVPGRHEPDDGEVNYSHLFELIDETGYEGWIGCEYRPRGDTMAGLGWAKRWGIG